MANRLAQCDEDAFTSIYQQFKDRLYQYALCIVGRAMVAEDVVQDVFIKFVKQVDPPR